MHPVRQSAEKVPEMNGWQCRHHACSSDFLIFMSSLACRQQRSAAVVVGRLDTEEPLAKSSEPYGVVVVDSFKLPAASGLHGQVHIRPVAGQQLPTTLFVECSKKLPKAYPVGTNFRIRAKLTDREGGGEYLCSFHGWAVEVLT